MKQALRILRLPPVKLETAIDRLSTTDRVELAKELEGVAIAAGFCAEYVNKRAGEGCGDQGHKDSLAAANRVRKLTRRALGYHITYPVRA